MCLVEYSVLQSSIHQMEEKVKPLGWFFVGLVAGWTRSILERCHTGIDGKLLCHGDDHMLSDHKLSGSWKSDQSFGLRCSSSESTSSRMASGRRSRCHWHSRSPASVAAAGGDDRRTALMA
jgi:hypothetical protein